MTAATAAPRAELSPNARRVLDGYATNDVGTVTGMLRAAAEDRRAWWRAERELVDAGLLVLHPLTARLTWPSVTDAGKALAATLGGA